MTVSECERVPELRATQHRADIDGLRAIAVVPVLMFHAQIPWCPGGSVGVDIFFVISGYLISRIILRDLAQGRFSMVTFLERRVRRILPALYVVMAASTALAWHLMLADNLENFGQSLTATALSANNILVWLTSGYWGIAAEFKPLLHTWSLGVEEQFYLIYPILLLLMFRWRRAMLTTLIAMTVLSLGLAQWGHSALPVANFLLLPFRAFELLIGGVLAHIELFGQSRSADRRPVSPRMADALCVLGLGAILYSFATFTSQSAIPGLAAVLPVGGSAVLIWFGRADRGVGRLLALPPLVGIGAISYSLYLWHQPVLAFYRMTCTEPPSMPKQVLAVCASFPLAWLSWKYVETPFRTSRRITREKAFIVAIAGIVMFAGVGITLDAVGGLPNRVPGMSSAGEGGERRLPRHEYVDRMFRYSDRDFSQDARPKVLVIGNSYARDLLNSIEECSALSGWEISYVPIRALKSLSTLQQPGAWPEALAKRLKRCDLLLIAQGDIPIFVSDDWSRDRQVLQSMGARNILVIGTKNFGWNPNCIMSMGAAAAVKFRPLVEQQSWDWNQRDRGTFGPDFIDLLALLCDQDRRTALFTTDGKLISEDGRHLTPQGARFIGKLAFSQPLWQRVVKAAADSAAARATE
jgi:peptidoglycan/LPS O-acetylase OafA/YrhL